MLADYVGRTCATHVTNVTAELWKVLLTQPLARKVYLLLEVTCDEAYSGSLTANQKQETFHSSLVTRYFFNLRLLSVVGACVGAKP